MRRLFVTRVKNKKGFTENALVKQKLFIQIHRTPVQSYYFPKTMIEKKILQTLQYETKIAVASTCSIFRLIVIGDSLCSNSTPITIDTRSDGFVAPLGYDRFGKESSNYKLSWEDSVGNKYNALQLKEHMHSAHKTPQDNIYHNQSSSPVWP